MSEAVYTPTYGSNTNLLSLPPELILEIYTWATLNHYSDIDMTAGPPRGAVLSQICRPLRSLAISSQNLWNHVPRSSSSALTELCLARAPTAPLQIALRAYYYEEENLAAKKLILPHLSRARYIRMYVQFDYENVNEELTLIFDALKSQSMPLLETFDVEFVTIDFNDRNYSCVTMPQPLFNGAQPARLKTLTLRQAGTPRWSLPSTMPISAFSTTLRSLDLHNSCLWSNVDEMVQFFQTIPLLEYLEYTLTGSDSHLFDTTPSQIHPPRCVALDRLRTLITREYSTFNSAMAVFGYLAIPPRAKVYLYVDIEDDLWTTEHSVHARDESYIYLGTYALREHFAAAIAAGEHYDRLRLDDESRTLCPQHLDDDWSQARRFRHLPSPARLGFCVPNVSEALRPQAFAMYLTLPIFTKVTQLSVTGLIGEEVWIALEEYKDVRTLHLRKDALLAFVLFCALPPRPHIQVGPAILFPALEEFCVEDDDVSPSRLRIYGTMFEVALDQYLGPGTRTVVYIDGQSCTGAEEFAGWLRGRPDFDAERVIIDPDQNEDEEWDEDDGEGEENKDNPDTRRDS